MQIMKRKEIPAYNRAIGTISLPARSPNVSRQQHR